MDEELKETPLSGGYKIRGWDLREMLTTYNTYSKDDLLGEWSTEDYESLLKAQVKIKQIIEDLERELQWNKEFLDRMDEMLRFKYAEIKKE